MDNHEALQRFEAYLRRRYPDRRTPTDYISDIRQFQSCCSKAWDTVTVHDVDAFVDQMHQKKLQPTTIKRRLVALKTYFDFLADETGQPHHPNPVRPHRHVGKLGRHLPRDLSDADLARVLNVLQSARDRALVTLMWRAGLRVGEVVRVDTQDLIPAPQPDLPPRLRVLGKGQKERIVYLSADAVTALEAWLHQRPPTDCPRLFLNERGQPLSANGVEWLLKGYGEQVGIHLTPHRLRHTFARQLTEARMPIESLARLMGHAQISTTQLYQASADPGLRDTFIEAMQRIEQASAPRDRSLTAETPRDSAVTPPPMVETPRHSAILPTECASPPLPDWSAWAPDLPAPIRQACVDYVQRHLSGWRPRQRRLRALHVLGDFERFFRWVLAQRALTTVSALQPPDLQGYMEARRTAGNRPRSVKAALDRVFGLLHELAEQGEPISPALLRLPRPALPDALPRALSESEAQRLTAQARLWLNDDTPEGALDAAWFFLLADAGLRICELLDVRQRDVDLAQGRLMVRQGKNDRDRVVYLTETATQALQRYLTRCPHPEHALLFVRPNGKALSYEHVYSRLRDLGNAAQVAHLSPHRLRHTFATRLVNAGLPITSLQKLLGHDRLSTTQIYVRLYDQTVERDFRQAMERLQQVALAVPAEWFQRPALAAVPSLALDNSV
jgi:site-specific recombinase XerD